MINGKIVITVGPATDSLSSLVKLIKKGVNVFRLNFSHATHEYHKEISERIREASKKVGKEVAILQDISGPKIRVAELKTAIELKVGDIITLTKDKINENEKMVSISYPEIIDSLKIGDLVYFADGIIRSKVVEVSENFVKCKIKVGNVLTSRKGVNFPNATLPLGAITPKDKKDLEFGATIDIDLVALSFVSSPNDIKIAKEILTKKGVSRLIFAKIEKKEAIDNLKAILEEADGVMVARGDLGVELGVENVPVLQKRIIKEAISQLKPTIVATQMLTSMIDSPYPTRAETSDIANAILDGADAVMLSDETTIGKYPLKAVEVLHSTIKNSEKIQTYYRDIDIKNHSLKVSSQLAVVELSKSIKPEAIISFSRSGKSATLLSGFRPKERIIMGSYSLKTIRQLQVVWGINDTILLKEESISDKLVKQFLEKAEKENIIKLDKNYIITIGYPFDMPNSLNSIKILNKDSMKHILENR